MIGVVERPILFSADMVLAILDGRKSQTRRVVKPQPDAFWDDPNAHADVGLNAVVRDKQGRARDVWITCPYGQPGNRLWVREAFFDHGDMGGLVKNLDERVEYRATEWDRAGGDAGGGWKPSIHMPRWASRLTLEIAAVRVERLQDMRPGDYEAEGCVSDYTMCELDARYSSLRRQYRDLWDSLNAKRGYGWDVNPLVWVVEFRRIQQQAAA